MTVLFALSLWLVEVVLAAWAMELSISACCLSRNSNGDRSDFRSTQLGPPPWGGQQEAMGETYSAFNPFLLRAAEKDLGGCFELAVK